MLIASHRLGYHPRSALIGKAGRSWCACLAFLLLCSATSSGAVERTPVGVVPSRICGPNDSERTFLAENGAAMTRMMAGMSIKPTGDVDRDFVDMMVPHHQGAIDMAVAVLRYGRNEKVRRLAQEIIVDQQQEIAAMRLAVGEPIPASSAAPTAPLQPPAAMPGMDMR
jgi:hypothetical protein